MSDSPNEVEQAIRAAWDAGEFERAATLTIEHYGPELLGFLVHHMAGLDPANEVFGEFCEVFWETLPRFEWRCSMRSWTYKLVRRVAMGYRKRERRRANMLPLSQFSIAIQQLRSATANYQRTDVKDRFRNIREQLAPEDRSLLALRLDRGLSWQELAEILCDEDEPLDPVRLKTETARLRKRYQLLRERMRKWLRDEGLA
jgi:RNA polymerase sigma-70 factor, ECF subfamily